MPGPVPSTLSDHIFLVLPPVTTRIDLLRDKYSQLPPSAAIPMDINPNMRAVFSHLLCVVIREQLVKELSTVDIKSSNGITAAFGEGARVCVPRHQRDPNGDVQWWWGVKAGGAVGVVLV